MFCLSSHFPRFSHRFVNTTRSNGNNWRREERIEKKCGEAGGGGQRKKKINFYTSTRKNCTRTTRYTTAQFEQWLILFNLSLKIYIYIRLLHQEVYMFNICSLNGNSKLFGSWEAIDLNNSASLSTSIL